MFLFTNKIIDSHRLKFMDGWPLRGRKSVHAQALISPGVGRGEVKGIFHSGNACNQNNNQGIYGLEQILFDLTIFFVCCLSALLTPSHLTPPFWWSFLPAMLLICSPLPSFIKSHIFSCFIFMDIKRPGLLDLYFRRSFTYKIKC